MKIKKNYYIQLRIRVIENKLCMASGPIPIYTLFITFYIFKDVNSVIVYSATDSS